MRLPRLLTDRTTSRRVRLRLVVAVALLAALPSGVVTVLRTDTGGAQAATSPAGTARPLRVMFVGDSMTQGRPGAATYRYWMWREFGRQGVRAAFVGPRSDLSTPERRYQRAYEHLDHGFGRELAHAALAHSTFAYHLPRIRREVATYRPGLVVLQLGYNDSKTHGAGRILSDTSELLRRVWAVDPAIRVVLGEIPPSARTGRAADTRRSRGADANALIAAEYADDPRVAIAHHVTDADRPWRPRTDTYDGVHPNAVGETLFAQRFSEALVDLGVFSKRVRVFHQAPWTPKLPRVATGGRGRISVDLAPAVLASGAPVRRGARVRVYTRPHGGKPVRTSPWMSRARFDVRLPAGRYWIETVVRRGPRMVSTSEPRARVTVR